MNRLYQTKTTYIVKNSYIWEKNSIMLLQIFSSLHSWVRMPNNVLSMFLQQKILNEILLVHTSFRPGVLWAQPGRWHPSQEAYKQKAGLTENGENDMSFMS